MADMNPPAGPGPGPGAVVYPRCGKPGRRVPVASTDGAGRTTRSYRVAGCACDATVEVRLPPGMAPGDLLGAGGPWM